MSDEVDSTISEAREDRPSDSSVDQLPKPPLAKPPVTLLAIAVCIGVFLGISTAQGGATWETLARFGYLPAQSVWSGGTWSLVTSAFVHIEIWHLVFNLCWLWTLGSRMEREIGPLAYLIFILMAAFVSSACQLAVSDETGIGFSGVLYAIFGFMWVSRRRYPSFSTVINRQNIQLFLVWMVICIVITQAKILKVGNTAHLMGLVFGINDAAYFVLQYRPRLSLSALLTLLVLSIVPLVWCPWSVAWLSVQAYNAHVALRYHDALAWYSRIIERDPKNAWAYLNRSGVYTAIDHPRAAKADYDKALQLDPDIVDEPAAE